MHVQPYRSSSRPFNNSFISSIINITIKKHLIYVLSIAPSYRAFESFMIYGYPERLVIQCQQIAWERSSEIAVYYLSSPYQVYEVLVAIGKRMKLRFSLARPLRFTKSIIVSVQGRL